MRPRSLVGVLVLMILLTVPSQATALMMHYFSCSECHDPTLDPGALGVIGAANNLCLRCHTSGSPLAVAFDDRDPLRGATVHGTKTPDVLLSLQDASDALGSATAAGMPAPPTQQTSHFWASPTNVVPAAGAEAPSLDLYKTRSNTTGGKVACSTCHDPHGMENTQLLRIGKGAVLTANDMCLDCHRSWNNTAGDHGVLSHPAVADYTTTITAANDAYKVKYPEWKPEELPYKAAPDNSTTLKGNVTLVNGGVSCTSCHGVHFADSDASTEDIIGSVGLVGDGFMLKHNGPSKDKPLIPGAGDSICQTCHQYKGHGSASPVNPMGCTVCHGGHAYDPNGFPNYYVLRKTITIDGDVTPNPNDGTDMVTVNVDYTSLTSKWMDGGAGFCEGCHDLGASHNTLTTGDAQTGCGNCHSHDKTTFTGGGCNTCHGYAPSQDVASGLFGFAADPDTGLNYRTAPGVIAPKDESLTAHLKHSDLLGVGSGNYDFSCGECHSNFGTGHRDGLYQDVAFAALAQTGTLTPAPYAPVGTGACATIYCHSNGRTRGTAPNVTSIPAWQGGSIAGCIQCHGADNDTMSTRQNSAAHEQHLANGYSCSLCHNDTASNASTLAAGAAGGTHVDGTVDVVWDPASTLLSGGAGLSFSANGTCSVYCHDPYAYDGANTPDWDTAATWDGASSVACGSCHGNPPAQGTHLKHVSDADGPGLSCDTCHPAGSNTGSHAGHISGGAADTLASLQTSVCNTCHGATLGGSGADAEPVWTDSTSVTCATCHTGSAISIIGAGTGTGTYMDVAAFYTSGHGDSSLSGAPDCTGCHEAAAAGHFDGDSADDRLIAASTTNDAFCNNCHGTENAHFATTGSSATGDSCYLCHNPHKATNGGKMLIVGSGYVNGAARSDFANGSGTGVCQTCHASGEVLHFDNTGLNESASHQGSNVCTSCHTHSNTPAFMYGAGTSCDGCHGFPPATAAHTQHAPDSYALDLLASGNIDKDVVDRSACAYCHEGAELYTYNTATDQGNSLNHGLAATRPSKMATIGYTGSNCTAACHDGASGVAAVWSATSLACDACHFQAVDPTQADNTANNNPVSAGHNAHFAGGGTVVCADCHGAVADTSHITDQSGASEFLKVQGMANAQLAEATVLASATFDAGALTCATASCHSNARPGEPVPTSAWGIDDPNCTQCHAAAPSTGSHDKHIPDAADCSTCHTSALQGASYINTNHYDGDIDVAAGGYPTDKAINSAFTGCTTATCHDDGRSANTTPDWGTAAADSCVACHDAIPATGSHVSHVADAAVACADCHAGALQSTTAPTANHRDGSVNAGSGYPVQPKGSAFSNCSTATCHNDGRNGGVTGTWGTALDNCSECHATVPATGGHGAHVGVSFAGSAIACADCHAGAVQGSDAPTANHRDGNVNAAGYPVQAKGSAFTTCSTATCHQTGQAANAYKVTSAWDVDDANCTQCHEASPITGSHGKHIAINSDCVTCHTDAVINTSYASAQHGDLNIDVAVGGYTADKALGAVEESCTLSCHSDGMAATGASPVWGTVTGGCTACHESDMATGSHTAHLADGATCGACHDGAVKDNNSGTAHTDGNVDVTATYATANAAYGSASWTTCSTASCHVDGRANRASYAWGTVISDCSECHATQPATGSHAAHIADGATCGQCHTGSVEGTTAPTANHRDGSVNAGSGYPVQVNGSTFSNCATATCHNDGRNGGVTGTWGTALDNCSECHATVPTTGGHGAHVGVTFAGAVIACADCHTGAVQGSDAPTANHRDGFVNAAGYPVQAKGSAFSTCSTATCHQTGQAANAYKVTSAWDVDDANCTQCHEASPITGSHGKHIAINSDCVTCHADAVINTSYASAQHGDLNIDVAVGGYTADKALGAVEESCTLSCHSDGMAATGASPVWGTVTGGCTACHESDMATGSHTAHLADGADCGACHDGALKDSNSGTAHTDGNVDVIATYATANAAYGSATWTTCSAASCHDDGRTPNVTATWGTTVDNCAECHATQPATGSHAAHLAATALGSSISCGSCHTGSLEGTTAPTADHRDGNVNAVNYPMQANGSPFTSCATVNCHSNGVAANGNTPVWGTAGDCTTCHLSDMTSGGHTIHLANGALCGDCHDGATKDSNAGTAHIDGNVDAVAGYAMPNAPYGSASYTTCNAALCHDNGTGTLVTTPAWGQSAACTECHTTVTATAAHSKHLNAAANGITSAINCTDCHAGAIWGTSATTAGHRDGNVDVTGGYGYPADATKGAPYDTCATSYCHGDAMPKGTVSGTTNAPNWGATSTGCTFCHDVAAAPVAITAHTGKTLTDCITCHDNTNAAGTGFVDPSLHINGSLEGGGDSCIDCHGNVGSTLGGAHAAHNNVAFNGLLSNGDYGSTAAGWYNVTYTGGVPSFACGYCHPSTVAGHMTKQVSLNPADAGAAGTVKALNNGSAAYNLGVCSATYCHSDGVNVAAGLSPNWSTGSIGVNCNDCHGNSPTTAAHGVHEIGIHYEELYSGTTGLITATGTTGSGAGHGDPNVSSTITCVTCHFNTMANSANAGNTTCGNCHTDTNTVATGNELASIKTTSNTHLNGVKDVAFADLTVFKSKAQLRDNLVDADDGGNILSNLWNRITGYKAAASHDVGRVAATPYAGGSCATIVCHNGNTATWQTPQNNCMTCHTSLPK